jgi:DNA-binding transcriptional ArsR family regulator
MRDGSDRARLHEPSPGSYLLSRIAAATDVFHAVADPTRRLLLDRLKMGSAPVHVLAEGLPMSRPAVSKHLKVLRDAHLVRETKDGRERLYELNPQPLRDVASWIESYRTFWATNLGSLKAFLEREE